MDSFSAAQAYPPPVAPAPYPGGAPPTTPLPPVYATSPPNLNTPYSTYLPLIPHPIPALVPVQFSLAGAEADEAAFLNPSPNTTLGPYKWNDIPNEDSTTQMFRRCHGSPRAQWCWIAGDTYHAGLDRTVRTNMGNLSTTNDYPPYASGGRWRNDFRPDNATNGNTDRRWVSGTLSPTQYLTLDLHPTYIDNITLSWWYTSGYGLTTTHATAYNIQARTAANSTWTTIYATTTSNGYTDTITLPGNLLATDLRLNLTTPATPGHHYAIADLKAYGDVDEPFFQRGTDMATWVAANPGRLWLIGNEPDNFDIRFGDGLSLTLYADLYATVGTLIKDNDPTAQLIFCQGTIASGRTLPPAKDGEIWPYQPNQFPFGAGFTYCEAVIPYIEAALITINSPYTFADLVQGVATHQYIGATILPVNLADQMWLWETRLLDFQSDINGISALAGKPLYLTEYGDYDNICPEVLPLPTPVPTPLPTATPIPPPDAGCGDHTEGYAFYGEHYQEGYWAILHHTTEFFLSPRNTQWHGAWWFYVGDQRRPEQANRGDVYFDKVNFEANDSGLYYHNSLNCHLNGLDCP